MKAIWQYKVILAISLCSFNLSAQLDSAWSQKPSLTVSGFLDVFYVYDFNQPQGSNRQPFFFNHNRHNEFNLNLGVVKIAVEQTKYRANIALQTGTYSNDNYSEEPGLLKNIFEANIGISLNKKNNLWLDAGILPSYIGFESAISMDNWTMTRSILAENSPYFVSGAKLTFKPSQKLELAALMMNGWQRIQRLQGNSLPSFGTQLKLNPSEKVVLNWSTFIGTDSPDSTRRMRCFSNLYGQFQLTDRVGLIAGFDLGAEQRLKNSAAYDVWFSPVVIAQFTLSKNWKTALRAEYYQDDAGVIISTIPSTEFRTSSISLNVDYSPIPMIVCRIEGRWLNSENKIFETTSSLSDNNFFIGTSIALKFSEMVKK